VQHGDADSSLPGCPEGEPQDGRTVSRVVDADDHAANGAPRTDGAEESDYGYRAWGASEDALRPARQHAEGSCRLITPDHHQGTFPAFTADPGRGRTGLEMRTYVEIRCDQVRATYRLEDQVLGGLDSGWVKGTCVKDPERVHVQGPGEFVHDVKLAPAGGGLGGRPVQCLPPGLRTVDSDPDRPRVLGCLRLCHRTEISTTSRRWRGGVDAPEQSEVMETRHAPPPSVSPAGAAATSPSW
jgi:hypothetical protein